MNIVLFPNARVTKENTISNDSRVVYSDAILDIYRRHSVRLFWHNDFQIYL